MATNLHALALRLRKQVVSGISSALSTHSTHVATKHAVALVGCAAIAGAAYLYHTRYSVDDEMVQSLLNADYEGLATDEIEEGPANAGPTTSLLTEAPQMSIVIGDIDCPTIEPVCPPATAGPRSTNIVEICGKPALVELHRGVRKGRQMQYMNAVIAECKVKFGVPSNKTSNRLAVERFASGVMKKHGMRPSHIRQYLPLIVKMVFVPDKWQVEAERVAGARTAWKAVMEYLWYNARSVAPRDDHC